MINPWREQSKVNPQLKDGHRRINNEVFQALYAARLPGAIYQIVLVVIDRTWGFREPEAAISLSYFEKETGLSRQSVSKAIQKAESLRLIVVERHGTNPRNPSRYMFNKHFDTWLTRQLNHTSKDKLLGNQITPDWATKSPQTSQVLTPTTEPVKKPLKKYIKEIYIVIFKLWNDQGIIQHRKFTGDIKRAIDSVLRDHTQEEVILAIKNYAEIVQGDDYWFSWKWTLKDFLKRGIDKFIDLEIAKGNYRERKGGKDGTHRQGPKRLKPRDQYKDPEQHRQAYHQGQEVGA